VLRVEQEGGKPSFLVRLGELVFRSPETLGGNAAKAGISCDTCHTGGAKNVRFFIPGLSSKPGTVDVTHYLWNRLADDGIDNPLSIPSLRDIGEHAPYGFRGQFQSLREFTGKVIVQEFAGAEPPPIVLDALIAYENELAPLPNPLLAPDGKLTEAAPPEARAGEPLFRQRCAACHVPEYGFLDFHRHDVGSGGPVETPSLLGLQFDAPYFHDGRYDTVAEVIDHFDRLFGLKLDDRDKNDLLAYLQAVGGGEAPYQAVTLSGDLDRLGRYIDVVRQPLLDEDAALAELVSRMLREEVGRIYARFQAPTDDAARKVLLGWAASIAAIGHLAEAHEFPQARAELDRLEQRLIDEQAPLDLAEATSLYDADTLRQALGETRRAGGPNAQ